MAVKAVISLDVIFVGNRTEVRKSHLDFSHTFNAIFKMRFHYND